MGHLPVDSIHRGPASPPAHAHLPGLQLEPQAQLCVVDDGVPPQLCQGQVEVGQGLLEPAVTGSRVTQGRGRRQECRGPSGKEQELSAHLSSWKLARPRWKKPTARQASLVTAWSNAWE